MALNSRLPHSRDFSRERLHFDAVNENCQWAKEYFNNPRKIFYTELWDDRAFNVDDIIRQYSQFC